MLVASEKRERDRVMLRIRRNGYQYVPELDSSAKGTPFTDGEYIKDTFLKSAEILFIDLPNLQTILSRIQEIPASAENVTAKQNSGLQESVALSIGLDESKDVCVNELHALQ
ncbi:hypothetical protein TNCV_4505021 [Trichonephila clavipes]|nr:hypothetical protein TNCV_4505021 [Trichonephila clavipes]